MSKRIKNYEEFVNEEINLKKALAGAALGASLAFGNPQDVSAQNVPRTEITQEITKDYSEVFHVDSTLSKSQIKTIVTTQLSKIPNIRVTTNLPDKIICSVTFNSRPDKSNGAAYGNMEISFKDGRYKVDFSNIYFDYMGQQPQTVGSQMSSTLGRQAAGIATSVLTSKIRNPILQNTARQAAGTLTRGSTSQPHVEKENLTYQQATSEEPEFATSIDVEIGNFTSIIKSGFSGKQVEEDW